MRRRCRSCCKRCSDENPGVRGVAAEALGKYGKIACKPVTALLTEPSAETRSAAIQALGSIARPESAPVLAKLLGDADAGICAAAIAALPRLGAPGVAVVLPLLKSEDATLRAHAAATLARMKASRTAPALAALLDDPSAPVRLWALAALGELPDEPSLENIVKGMQDHDPQVRGEAAHIIGARHLTVLARLLVRQASTGTTPERIRAHTALCALAGEDLGSSAGVWEKWVSAQEHGK